MNRKALWMKKKIKNKRVGRYSLFLSTILLTGYATFSPAQVRPEDDILQRIRFEQNLDAALPLDAVFTDHRGETVVLGDFFGDLPVIIVPMYYNCPMLCGLIVNGLLDSMRELAFNAGEHFEVVVMSFDPTETYELATANRTVFLSRYDRPGTEAGIHFLVGEEEPIRAVTGAIGFNYEWVPELNDFAHASGVVLATPEGRTSRYFFGIMYPPRDMRLGLVEASENRIGSPVDRLMLFCYQYDPSSGEYGLLVHRVVNTAAATTASVLGLFIFLMLRAEKRRNKG
jgi:protein SCO1